jgi:hypothetical protein
MYLVSNEEFPGSSIGKSTDTGQPEIADSISAQGVCSVHRHKHYILNTVPRKYTNMRKTRAAKRTTKAVPKVAVTSIPVNGHGALLDSGKAKVYSTPGLIGGAWVSRTGEVVFRKNDERCIPLKVVLSDYNVNTECIEVKTEWLQEEQQADLRDYVALKAGITLTNCKYSSPLYAALNIMPQDVPTESKAGDLFVWKGNDRLYYRDSVGWCKVLIEPTTAFDP